MKRAALAALLALAGCGPSGEQQPQAPAPETPAAAQPAPLAIKVAAKPDLAKCAPLAPIESEGMERKGPLAVPARFEPFAAADMDHVAVTTLGGAMLCADARYHDSAQDFSTFAGERFFGYAWFGYEANGFQLFDRAGKGTALDTGAAPVFSPSGKRFASAEWSPSGFGALNAVLVMDVLPDTIREAARFEQLPELSANWRIERWRGEDCFELSAEIDEARQRFTMRRGPGGWAFAPAPQGCPAG
ncbi:MAG TPA: hypothetical protein PKJ55_10360 [Novosphingobium sp.]|nr:hypothetical protein [Novosphingobium sp.]HPZ47430.1 hypothetical protein [Novosphingobium sp.]